MCSKTGRNFLKTDDVKNSNKENVNKILTSKPKVSIVNFQLVREYGRLHGERQ